MSPISAKSLREAILAAKPIRIRTKKYSTLQLRELSLNDVGFLEKLLKTDLPAREFTVQCLHHQLVEPALNREVCYPPLSRQK